jgi:predicted nucleic acid-binding protein
MGELKTYFFDTYALIEIIHGSPSYESYKECFIITTKQNLMELHYNILRIYGEKYADFSYGYFLKFVREVEDEVIKEANKFKFINKKRKLSYVDCIGYIMAKRLGIKFLTGDKQFEDQEDVEFVK